MSSDDKDNEDITVQIDEIDVLISLKLNETLSKTREILKQNLNQMDELLFAKKVNSKFAIIARDDEKVRTLEAITENKVLYLRYINEKINIYIDELQEPVSLRLNLNSNLSEIRQVLEKKHILFNIDNVVDILIFVNKYENTAAKIALRDEDKIILRDIIKGSGKGKALYLSKDSESKWKYLSDKFGCCHGINDKFEKANNPAFKIKNCEIKKIDYCKANKIEIDSEKALNVEKGWELTTDVDIQQNFAKLGLSIGNFKIKSSTDTTHLTRKIIEHGKVSLTFTLDPTKDFISAIEDAIKSKNPTKLKEVTNKFGQFIPKEAIFGGKAYFEESDTMEISNTSFKLFGGEQFKPADFNVAEWAKSLDDFKKWDCIRIDPISIFKLLPNDLQEKILALAGKKIHHHSITDKNIFIKKSVGPLEIELEIPEYISKYLNDKKADCSIFATVIDKKRVKDDFFTCQIFWPQDYEPKLIIHCIQNEFNERECYLKIRWMIIGNNINFNFNSPDFKYQLKVQKIDFNEPNVRSKLLDLECSSSSLCFGIPVLRELNDSNRFLAIGHHFFNDENNQRTRSFIFSYCLKEKHYDNLPKFTFHTLIIPNHIPDDCGKSKFETNFISESSYSPSFHHSDYRLKYISPYFTGKNNHCPIFLKQKINRIKIKRIPISMKCDQKDCICKNQLSKNSFIDYSFFDPKYETGC